jgi:hypothetical protein
MIKEVFADNKAVAAEAPGICWCWCFVSMWWELDFSVWLSIPF